MTSSLRSSEPEAEILFFEARARAFAFARGDLEAFLAAVAVAVADGGREEGSVARTDPLGPMSTPSTLPPPEMTHLLSLSRIEGSSFEMKELKVSHGDLEE